jgi:formylglycine-generating enzyme required for sulfatase activity
MPAIASVEEMRLVPGATYRMGSDPEELEGIRAATGLPSIEPLLPEAPSRMVTVADFLMDTFDVTNRHFASFVAAAPAWSREQADPSSHNGRYLEHWVDGAPPDELLDHPVTFVTWQAAVAYCGWRGKRLPTEIEYEWAAQGGVRRGEYPWGDSPPSSDTVNWGGNGIRATVRVGSYPPSARGLYDMSGNVWRFTSDPWLGSYSEMSDNSALMEESAGDPIVRRVVRGGSWGANAANLRVRYRDSHRAFDAREMVGFRCAKSVDETRSEMDE